jgi:hypothetical protein
MDRRNGWEDLLQGITLRSVLSFFFCLRLVTFFPSLHLPSSSLQVLLFVKTILILPYLPISLSTSTILKPHSINHQVFKTQLLSCLSVFSLVPDMAMALMSDSDSVFVTCIGFGLHSTCYGLLVSAECIYAYWVVCIPMLFKSRSR